MSKDTENTTQEPSMSKDIERTTQEPTMSKDAEPTTHEPSMSKDAEPTTQGPSMSKDTEHTSASFEILPATPHDVSDIAIAFYQSFYGGPNPLFENYNRLPIDVLIAGFIMKFIEFFTNRRMEFFKAVNTSTGATVGFSLFEFPLKRKAARSRAEQSLRPHGHLLLAKGEIPLWVPRERLASFQDSTLPSSSYDEDNYEEYESDEDSDDEGSLDMEAVNRWFNRDDDFSVKYLAVTPGYRRLRLGARLMRAGLKVADKYRAKVCLFASSMGEPLYLKLGFKVVEKVVNKTYTDTFMVRELKGKSEVPRSNQLRERRKTI